MYNIEIFEKFIKSNLTTEEIYNKIKEINPIYTKEKYINDSEEPYGVYVGGVGPEDLVTVNRGLDPLRMRFDSETIYLDFINMIRDKLKQDSNKSFVKVVLASIKNLSKSWFEKTDTPEAMKNKELAERFKQYFKKASAQRNGYAHYKSIRVNEEEIYNISTFAGAGDLAKCVEVNSVACNLLNFAGIESTLVSGSFYNYKGVKEAHTFPLYKTSNGNYALLDCILKQHKKNILQDNTNFEKGFIFKYPVKLEYSDGHVEESYLTYQSLPQKKITNQNRKKR